MSESHFNGFPEGLQRLNAIGRGDKSEFARQKAAWDSTIMKPTRELVVYVGNRLRTAVSPGIEAVPKVNGSISPITRDLRFATDKSRPYKDHLMINFWEGEPKKTAPTMRIRISDSDVGFAAGSAFDADGLTRWRKALRGAPGKDLAEILATAQRKGSGLSFIDPDLKRLPAGLEPAAPALEPLLRSKTFQVRFIDPTPKSVRSSAFADWAAERLLRLGTVHRWLLEHTR